MPSPAGALFLTLREPLNFISNPLKPILKSSIPDSHPMWDPFPNAGFLLTPASSCNHLRLRLHWSICPGITKRGRKSVSMRCLSRSLLAITVSRESKPWKGESLLTSALTLFKSGRVHLDDNVLSRRRLSRPDLQHVTDLEHDALEIVAQIGVVQPDSVQTIK